VYICNRCRRELSSSEVVVWAAEMHDTSTQEGRAWDEGLRVFFHPACTPPGFPASRYKIIGKTTVADAIRRGS
jgi:hypothetical protein